MLRNTVIPQLRELNPSFDDAVARFIDAEREQKSILDAATDAAYSEVATENGVALGYFGTHGDAFLATCLRRAFEEKTGGKKLSKKLTDALEDLAKNGRSNSKIDLSDGVTAEKRYSEIVFVRKSEAETDYAVVLGEGENTIPNAGVLTLTRDENGDIPAELIGKLEARPFRSGDRIKLREGAGTKSVAKLYSDAKVPSEARKKNPVIVCGEEVVHVCGFGTAERFKRKNGGLRADFILF